MNVNATIASIQAALDATGRATVKNFGTFTVVDKPARTARNPQTGAEVTVPAKRLVRFKPSKQAVIQL
jgi:DNA-binding protein HU-beta